MVVMSRCLYGFYSRHIAKLETKPNIATSSIINYQFGVSIVPRNKVISNHNKIVLIKRK